MSLASIVIPHYRTPDRLTLCLRCLERFTSYPHERIVVDNGSEPAVLEALRSRDDIVLLERRQGPEFGQRAHAEALDLGISHARGDYVVTLHSDTFVKREGWLEFLIDRLESRAYDIAGAGTQHLQPRSLYERWQRALRGEKPPKRVSPVFTIYRRNVFEGARFSDFAKVWQIAEPYMQSGRVLFLSRDEASSWAYHSGGSTKLDNLRHRRSAARRKERQLRAFLAEPEIRALLSAEK